MIECPAPHVIVPRSVDVYYPTSFSIYLCFSLSLSLSVSLSLSLCFRISATSTSVVAWQSWRIRWHIGVVDPAPRRRLYGVTSAAAAPAAIAQTHRACFDNGDRRRIPIVIVGSNYTDDEPCSFKSDLHFSLSFLLCRRRAIRYGTEQAPWLVALFLFPFSLRKSIVGLAKRSTSLCRRRPYPGLVKQKSNENDNTQCKRKLRFFFEKKSPISLRKSVWRSNFVTSTKDLHRFQNR